jgi:hypothetical protein
MTASAGPALHDLHAEYRDRVSFTSLYVREAHPGDRYPQTQDFDQKLQHAREYRDRDSIPWPVLVDGVDGALHRALDPRPHAAYVMAPDGTVAARVLWANDPRALRRALDAALAGDRTEIENRVAPMLRGTGCMYEIWDAAGGHAKTDVLQQAPPVYLSGSIARRLHPLPPLARGAVAMAAATVAPALVLAALARRKRH